MAKRNVLTREKAERYLSDVIPEYKFWIFQGPQVSNMRDLNEVLGGMRDEQFRYHVNPQKNDFKNWVRDVIGDRKLASDIAKIKTRPTMIKKVTNRITELERCINEVGSDA